MASSSSSSTTTSRMQRSYSYDVFLSFRGEDTRTRFTDHLYSALLRRGIRTFRDDDSLRRGKRISSELLAAIEASRCSVVVFSENYASSSWCLEELVKIIHCMNTQGQRVVPVFYDVDPSDVRKQRGSFGEVFARHRKFWDPDSAANVKRWSEALTQAANLSGHSCSPDRYESSFIEKIVQDIFNELGPKPLHVGENIVGIDSRVQDIELLLDMRSNEVRMVGVCGMGGIGKTTIALAVYNLISSQFEGSCFLSNVREVSRKQSLYLLEENLLSKVLGDNNLRISSVNEGVMEMKERFRSKRILLVLDDVDTSDQLETLAGGHDWFASGSRIIITTREKGLLDRHEVNDIYEVTRLAPQDSTELFSLFAFRQSHPPEAYMELTERLVEYAKGLPLALKVLGSYLRKKSTAVWRSEVEKLTKLPKREIVDVLRVSFEGLDDLEKNIFLDVACFFKGEDRDGVANVLNGCGFFADAGIENLLDKCLLTILDNRLWMHDLLQEMGRDIVCQESYNEPGKRSRLWRSEDVYQILVENKGTDAIEGIVLDSFRQEKRISTTESFSRMEKLRYLMIYYPLISKAEGFKIPSRELRCLLWHGYPLRSLPYESHPKHLVKLDMSRSSLEFLWKGDMVYVNLKIIILAHCKSLTETPDFSTVPNLELLVLEDCASLSEVHPSVVDLRKLAVMNLSSCRNLLSLPSSFYTLKFLKDLDLTACFKVDKFSEISESMPYLKTLKLGQTAIRGLPESIAHACNLATIDLTYCVDIGALPSAIWKLKSLEDLDVSHSGIKSLPDMFEDLPCLKDLKLYYTDIKELPSSIGHLSAVVNLNLTACQYLKGLPSQMANLSFLEYLRLNDCSRLEKLPPNLGDLKRLKVLSAGRTAITQVPASIEKLKDLEKLSLSGCEISDEGMEFDLGCLSSLRHLNLSKTHIISLPESMGDLKQLGVLKLAFCHQLLKLPKLPSSVRKIDMHDCLALETFSIRRSPQSSKYSRELSLSNCIRLAQNNHTATLLTNCLFEGISAGEYSELNVVLPGCDIPEWFHHRTQESSVSIDLSQDQCLSKLKGVTICAAFFMDNEINKFSYLFCDLNFGNGRYIHEIRYSIPVAYNEDRSIESDHVWIGYQTRFKDQLKKLESLNNLNRIQAEFSFSCKPWRPFTLKRVSTKMSKCGIRLIYEDENPVPQNNSAMIQDGFSNEQTENVRPFQLNMGNSDTPTTEMNHIERGTCGLLGSLGLFLSKLCA